MKRSVLNRGLLLLLVFPLLAGCALLRAQEELEAINITMPDLSGSRDGTYRGSWETTLVKAEVEVVLVNRTITALLLLRHDNGRGGPAEAVLEDVLAAQTVEVDTITGATGSSKVILKAVETALRCSLTEGQE